MLGDGTLQPLLGVKKPSPAAKTRLQPATRGFLIPGEVTHCLMPGDLDLRHRPLVFASLWDETILPASLQICVAGSHLSENYTEKSGLCSHGNKAIW